MAEANPTDFPTVLGPDANFKGELSFEKGMRLQGKFEGKINTPGRLHVSREARLSADVDAGAIIVEGDVKGNLSAADRIELKATARYEGDLRASKLVVDEGAVFAGHVTVGPEAIKNRPPQGGNMGQARPPMGQPAGNAAGMPPANLQGQPLK
ncbi:MAG TPA: polymer-forming cytoskeletal protein [Tepidisphaeraceae bacterium]|jgi:cytoskeletal protein CcmA (bactofilin family)|nr:polymer-forming cytoskeletal protein [Tepidisphaeraceae bacterium]